MQIEEPKQGCGERMKKFVSIISVGQDYDTKAHAENVPSIRGVRGVFMNFTKYCTEGFHLA